MCVFFFVVVVLSWTHFFCSCLLGTPVLRETGMVCVKLNSALSLLNLLYPHTLPDALPSSPNVGVVCGPHLALLSPSPFASPAPFPHSPITGWPSPSPNQPSCSSPDCGSHHISQSRALIMLPPCSKPVVVLLPVTENQLEYSQLDLHCH